jgi:hypothetical protein
MDPLGGKIGGRPTELIYVDDQQKPDVGRRSASCSTAAVR